eukprot:765821-Hanusia_phi.AAC.4
MDGQEPPLPREGASPRRGCGVKGLVLRASQNVFRPPRGSRLMSVHNDCDPICPVVQNRHIGRVDAGVPVLLGSKSTRRLLLRLPTERVKVVGPTRVLPSPPPQRPSRGDAAPEGLAGETFGGPVDDFDVARQYVRDERCQVRAEGRGCEGAGLPAELEVPEVGGELVGEAEHEPEVEDSVGDLARVLHGSEGLRAQAHQVRLHVKPRHAVLSCAGGRGSCSVRRAPSQPARGELGDVVVVDSACRLEAQQRVVLSRPNYGRDVISAPVRLSD